MTTRTALRYRIIRGAPANYRTHHYFSQDARDVAARRFAEKDGATVTTEVMDEAGTWWCDGNAQPYADVLDALDFDPDPGDRIAARDIDPGDRVTVFGTDVPGMVLAGQNRDHQGIVEAVEHGRYQDAPDVLIVRVSFTDGRLIEALDRAVATRHHNPAPQGD